MLCGVGVLVYLRKLALIGGRKVMALAERTGERRRCLPPLERHNWGDYLLLHFDEDQRHIDAISQFRGEGQDRYDFLRTLVLSARWGKRSELVETGVDRDFVSKAKTSAERRILFASKREERKSRFGSLFDESDGEGGRVNPFGKRQDNHWDVFDIRLDISRQSGIEFEDPFDAEYGRQK